MSIALRVLLLATASLLVLSSCTPDMPPSWVRWNDRVFTCDVCGMQAQARVSVADGTARATTADNHVLDMPREWRVQDGMATDVDGDGTDELILLCWRKSFYGTSQPFWYDGSWDDEWSQHLFVHRLVPDDDGGCLLESVWMTSGLPFDVESCEADGRRVRLCHTDGTQSLWEWGSWGLKHVDQATIVVTGDIICHDSICANSYDAATDTFDFMPVFERIRPYVSSFDVAVALQETPLVSSRALFGTYPRFGTPTELGDALVDAGYDVVCAATNHVADKGEQGVRETLDYWGTRHPQVTLLGIHGNALDPRVKVIEAGGISIGLVNATEHLNGLSLERGATETIDTLDDIEVLLRDVGAAKAYTDAILCVLHIGDEYSKAPNATTREVVSSLIDAGTDVVVCSHPHVLQGVERIETDAGRTGVCYWSLGNLVSNQHGPETVLGGAAEITVSRDKAGAALVSDFDLTATISHFDERSTCIHLLDDYDEELAQKHMVNRWEPGSFTCDALRRRFEALRLQSQGETDGT